MPTILVVACAAGGLDELAPGLVCPLRTRGWSVQIVPTPNAAAWLAQNERLTELQELAAEPVSAISDYTRDPDTASTPPPDAAIAAPASFGTLNKLAAGIADNRATTKLCELLGARPVRPLLLAPSLNAAYVRHPAWETSMALLRGLAGVTVLNPSDLRATSEPGTQTAAFRWDLVLEAVPDPARARGS